IGSVLVENGEWSFTPETALPPGDHNFTVLAVDHAGNKASDESDPWFFTILPTVPDAPAITGISDDSSSVAVPIEKGGSTNDTTPTITGTAKPYDIVEVFVNDTSVGSVTANQDGVWEFTIGETDVSSPLSGDGEYIIEATATDPDTGRTSGSTGEYPIVLDTTAPAKPDVPDAFDDQGPDTGSITQDGTTDDTTPTFTGDGEDPGSTITILDGSDIIGTTTVDENGEWTWTPTDPLEDGEHSISIIVTDPAGNESDPSDPLDFTIDSSEVAISITKVVDDAAPSTGDIASGGLTNDPTPTFVGTATPGTIVTITDQDGTTIGSTTTDHGGEWTLTPDTELADRSHTFTASAENEAGGTDSTTFNLTIDTTAPDAPAIGDVLDDVGFYQGSLKYGDTTDDTTPTFTGSNGEPGSTITIYDETGAIIGQALVDNDGDWAITTNPLPEGQHDLTLTATDKAGNESDPTDFTLIVDTKGPETTATITSIVEDSGVDQTDFVTNNPELVIWAEVSNDLGPGEIVQISVDNGETWQTAILDSDSGKYFLDLTAQPFAGGEYTFVSRVMDAAGNPGPEASQTVSIDLDAPTSNNAIAITGYEDNQDPQEGDFGSDTPTNDKTPRLKGTVSGLEDGDEVVIKVTDPLGIETILGTADVTGEGWIYQVKDDQALTDDGDYTFTAVIRDLAGNEGTSSDGFILTVDTTAPAGEVTIDSITTDTGDPGDFDTSDQEPTITCIVEGTLEAGDYVEIRITDSGNSSEILGWTKATLNEGKWELDLENLQGFDPLEPGSYTIEARLADLAGNVADPVSKQLKITLTPAENTIFITAIAPDNGILADDFITNKPITTITGTLGTPLQNGEFVQVQIVASDGSIDDQSWINAFVDGTGTGWSLDTTDSNLAAGDYTIHARIMNTAGVEGDTTTQDLTIDTTAPDATITIDSISADSGVLGDFITNDKNPKISGTVMGDVDVNDYIEVRITTDAGNTLIGTYEVAITNDAWELDQELLPGGLLDGEYTIEAQIKDKAGNVGPAAESKVLVIDTTAPAGTVTIDYYEDDVVLDTSDKLTGSLTNDNTPVLHGTVTDAEAGDYVAIYDNITGELLGTVTIDVGDVWTFNVPPLTTDDVYNFTACLVDKAGNEGTLSPEFTLTLDTTLSNHTITIDSISQDTGIEGDFNTTDQAPEIRVEATGLADDEFVQVRIVLNGADPEDPPVLDWTNATLNPDDGTWTLALKSLTDFALDQGAYTIEARVVDLAGNVGETPVEHELIISNITIDYYTDDEDMVTGDFERDTITNDPTPTLQGSTILKDQTDKVVIYEVDTDGNEFNLGSATINTNTNSWKFEVPVFNGTNGEHTYIAKLCKSSGEPYEGIESTPFTLTIDRTPPEGNAQITEITADTIFPGDFKTGDNHPDIFGTTTETLKKGEFVQIRLLDSTGTETIIDWTEADLQDNKQNWSSGIISSHFPDGIASGSYIIEARTVDAYGNPAAENNVATQDLVIYAPGTGSAIYAWIDSITTDTPSGLNETYSDTNWITRDHES
ncbi:Ig-like domain-containing protein, partial [Desulfococcaceae bacterium OttesenSCG-928-F15]|nr:Ig-like domain-containing protein [Desulfococcaceae bacterium OttesenSCG-928-F15]